MFNSMKSHLKEKSGKEVKFVPQKSSLSRASRQGSESSISSLILDHPVSAPQNPPLPVQASNPPPSPTGADLHQIKLLSDGKVLSPKEVSVIAKKEDEWRGRLEKKDTEWSKKYEKRETELLKELAEKQQVWSNKERELTEDLLKQTNELKDTLKLAEELKRKVIDFQEEKDQVESFQTQEMAKIKHLLLAKERETAELCSSLKESQSQVETMKSEIFRLKPLEEKVADIEEELEMVRHSGEKERQSLVLLLTESQEQVSHLSDRVALLAKRSSDSEMASEHTPDNRIQALLGERTLLERRLEEAHIHLADIKGSWSAKISSLETQVGRLSRQAGEEGVERRRAEQRVQELDDTLSKTNQQLATVTETLASVSKERDNLSQSNQRLSQTIVELKEERNKLRDEVKRISELEERLSTLETQLETTNMEKQELETQLQDQLRRYTDIEQNIALARESMEDEVRTASRQSEELVLRNAQLSQQADMALSECSALRQELEQALTNNSTMQLQLTTAQQETAKAREDYAQLEKESKSQAESTQRTADTIQQLTASAADLEGRLAERNKTIRVLQQNLSDMKKTLRQREMRGVMGDTNHVGTASVGSTSPATISVTNSSIVSPTGLVAQTSNSSGPPDVNFQYLKHVIVKFLTSREYEAQHLTKAVATLLQLTAEEELLIRDTLDWKMSWFGSRPKLQDYS